MKIIVSLTSYQPRFNKLHLCLETLLHQSFSPDKIILYLDKDVKHTDLSLDTTILKDRGIEIVITDKCLKSHTKYFYAIQEYPEDIVITVDDDVYYSKDLILLLLKSFSKFPKAVSAIRTRKINMNKNYQLAQYANWDFEYSQIAQPDILLFATGVGGVLYPPHCLSDEVFNFKIIERLCLFGDDIWLKFMQLLINTPVVCANTKNLRTHTIEGTQDSALFKMNLENNRNDIYIQALMRHYKIDFQKLQRGKIDGE